MADFSVTNREFKTPKAIRDYSRESMRVRNSKLQHVPITYFAATPLMPSMVKIGTTTSIVTRESSIRTLCPGARVFDAIAGDQAEKDFKYEMKMYHYSGEWYEVPDNILSDWIEANRI